jgi:hypothetical protein
LQLFTERVKSEFAGIPNVEITVRDEGKSLFVMILNDDAHTLWVSSMGSGKGNGEYSSMPYDRPKS